MIARPSAKFARPRVHVSLIARPYESRNVCVLPSTHDHRGFSGKCSNHTHYTRGRVLDAVARGEMTFIDSFNGMATKRSTNLATFTHEASGTWQKTQSGNVACMQLKVGAKGRHIPVYQREPELVLA